MKRNIFNQLVKGLTLVSMITSLPFVSAQVNHLSYKARYAPLSSSGFELSIQNITQPTDRTIEFDVYLLDKDPLLTEIFELSSAQLGLFLNKGISTGTFSFAMNNTGSGLIASGQQFPSSSIVDPLSSYPDKVLLRVSGRSATAGSGAKISKIGYGTFLSHFTVTSTTAWVTNSTPNIEFLSNTVTNPLYATRVNQFIGTTDTQMAVNPGVNAKVYGNPVLNPPIATQSVTGGGSYCQGNAGVTVGLSGSEAGVTYTLYKNNVPTTTTAVGDGSFVTFPAQTAGTYTVKGSYVNGANAWSTTDMTGSAVIIENTNSTVSLTIDASSNPVFAGVSVTLTPTPVNGGLAPAYEWFVNNVSVGTAETYSYIPTDGDQVYAKLISNSASPCLIGNPATSNTITMTVSIGTGTDKIDLKDLAIFSSNKIIHINCPVMAQQISIYTMQGSLVKSEQNVSGLTKINMSNFANEGYVVKVITSNGVATRKILLK